ncbi:AAA family ATPase [Novosphingobium sp.]|uniref:AAA family ATPase n=1 Tax=Novosphingobium sp. TaxID=1874826 RepID=UPI00263613CC|nr:AAA family ATPase [Novosphingobium sp.]
MLLRAMQGVTAASPPGKSLLEFGRNHAGDLLGLRPAAAKKLNWTALKRAAAGKAVHPHEPSGAVRLAGEVAALLRLDPVDAGIVTVVFAMDRVRMVRDLGDILRGQGDSLPAMIGEIAGADRQDAERRVRLNPLFRMGLAVFRADWRGQIELETRWALDNLLDRMPESEDGIIAQLVGPRQTGALPLEAFAHVAEADFLRRLLEGTRAERAAGINVLIHGPPGTGKTEFARALAEAAGLMLHSAGEADDDGREPDRADRLAAFQMGQRLLAGRGDAALLFDEMEDLIGDAAPTGADFMRGRQGSKVFVNRMLETNPVPVIWTTNAIRNVDPAILRRTSFVLKLGHPSRATALRMLEHVAAEERVAVGAGWAGLVDAAPEAASVLRVAARGGRLAGEADGGLRAAQSLVKALRGTSDLPPGHDGTIDFDLFETDRPLQPLFEAVAGSAHADVSLLLTGVPGTGKTALAHTLAQRLDRPLLVKRASDLLSKWVGDTERLIAEAFAEARARGGVLLFDEVDSLLFDRTTARASWEVSQVNELLTWLDRHPLPVVAATNHVGKLDPATMRRFVFKLELRALSPVRAGRAFTRFFGMAPPLGLAAVRGLTPGDMAVVKRQLRFADKADAGEILARLREEVAAKPETGGRIGF